MAEREKTYPTDRPLCPICELPLYFVGEEYAADKEGLKKEKVWACPDERGHGKEPLPVYGDPWRLPE